MANMLSLYSIPRTRMCGMSLQTLHENKSADVKREVHMPKFMNI